MFWNFINITYRSSTYWTILLRVELKVAFHALGMENMFAWSFEYILFGYKLFHTNGASFINFIRSHLAAFYCRTLFFSWFDYDTLKIIQNQPLVFQFTFWFVRSGWYFLFPSLLYFGFSLGATISIKVLPQNLQFLGRLVTTAAFLQFKHLIMKTERSDILLLELKRSIS